MPKTARTASQMSAGLRGVTPGILDKMATIRKYRFANLLY